MKLLNILKTKVNNDATTLIHVSQYRTDKQNLEKKIRDADKKIPDTSGLVTTTVLKTKISEVENKIPDTSSLVTTTVSNTKIGEVENKILDHSKYITTNKLNMLNAENFAARLKQANLISKFYYQNQLILIIN